MEPNYWQLIKKFLQDEGLVKQHISSYNDFIDCDLQSIIDEIGEIPIETERYPLKINLGKISIGSPRAIEVDGAERQVYPMEARLRNLTYTAPMHLEMTTVIDGREARTEMVYIGDIPVLLKSKICHLNKLTTDKLRSSGEDPLDPGGYFIVNGSERVIVALEDLSPNKILVEVEHTGVKPTYKAKIFSTTVGFRARIEAKMKSDSAIYLSTPGMHVEIPIIILIKALGVEEDLKIAEMISSREEIKAEIEASLEKTIGINTQNDALLYLGNRLAPGQVEEFRIRRAENLIDRNLLPHIGVKIENRFEKAYFLAEITRRIIELKLGLRDEDDKDHYSNKRLKLAGPLLADLFRVAVRALTRDMKYQLEKVIIRRYGEILISNAVRPGIITERLQHAIATGNWVRGRVGITQLLDRTNFYSTLSHLRRLQSPLSRSQPNLEARDLHSTHWGRLCPNETPEGSNCGLVKNLALSAEISVGCSIEPILKTLLEEEEVPVKKISEDSKPEGAIVFINGIIIGYSEDPIALMMQVKQMRREGKFSYQLNIAYYPNQNQKDSGEVYINCDTGRIRRPLIIVENGEPLFTHEDTVQVEQGKQSWNSLIQDRKIEYLDADEEENALIALDHSQINSETTHLEIFPYSILGVCASLIPYSEHNQSPRNAYESAMAKQALGVYSSNYFNRVDSRAHLLNYPQIPIVITKSMEITHYNRRPSGQNAILAVLTSQSYNMEDAIIMNRSSIDRGLARSTFFRTYEGESRQYLGGLRDKFEIPETNIRGYRGDQYYRQLEEDGIIPVEADGEGNTALIGRTSPPRFLEEYREFEVSGPARRDSSICMRPSETGTVDSIFITESIEGNKLVKVRVRDIRIPQPGDKFASRHGQKGVIGLLVPAEDMPFTENGIMPDIIINPHAFPSRMTIGQFIESIAGKLGALEGRFIDGTPFNKDSPEVLRNQLLENGFQHKGREVLYNGISGEKLEVDIFIGVVYYQKLHHMVTDKMHARARGQVQMLTRQPTEGRARGGGLRFGEMERDCLIGHGASALLMDRLLEESDKATILVCEECGLIAYHDVKQNRYVCRICGEKVRISPVALSYAFKLLLQELVALGIVPRLELKERA